MLESRTAVERQTGCAAGNNHRLHRAANCDGDRTSSGVLALAHRVTEAVVAVIHADKGRSPCRSSSRLLLVLLVMGLTRHDNRLRCAFVTSSLNSARLWLCATDGKNSR